MEKFNWSFTPTPLHRLERFSKMLNVDLWMKRDDLTGDMATGGNKLRKLEYILAHAFEAGATVLLTTGGPQSNHARATAAIAARAGLRCVLILAGIDPGHRRANLFINELVGAEIRFSGARTAREMEDALESAARELEAAGEVPYVIPIGGSNGIGTQGYVDALKELSGEPFDWMVVTAGSGGTFAGIYAGLARFGIQCSSGHRTQLLGISPWLTRAEIRERVVQCLQEWDPTEPWHEHRFLLDDQYIGGGYGRMTEGAAEAIQSLAQCEGILLDHVYTGKAMAGLIDYVRKGEILPGQRVLFWHTGGAPGLFAIQDRWPLR
jgi:D-cysteine desulfhydrase family pyridoxal phosphate-dependent enzyme